MISSVLLYFYGEEDGYNHLAVTRKFIRDYSNPMSIPEKQFVKNFRLDKQAFSYVLDELKDKFPPRLKTSGIPRILKVATALTFFAEGSYQRGVGNDFNLGLAQSTVSVVLKEFFFLMEEHLCPLWITQEEKREAILLFHERTGFPGVLGCIDGTHVAIVPHNKELQHIYRNRKGFFSLNALIVCDHNMFIRCVDVKYGGSMHDSLIWNMSRLKRRLLEAADAGNGNSWYLGDGVYPLETFLITPYRSAASGSPQAHFNKVHSQTRNIVERTIGLLKSRFRCLHVDRKLHYNAEKAISIVNSCSALHNIRLHFKVPEVDIDAIEIPVEIEENANETAHRIRDNIMRSLQY